MVIKIGIEEREIKGEARKRTYKNEFEFSRYDTYHFKSLLCHARFGPKDDFTNYFAM